MANPNEPQDKQIRVWIESGANCQSANEHFIESEDLGLSRSEWDALDEEQKMEAVTEYWNGQGYPEIGWDD